jgi:hypothetical protein
MHVADTILAFIHISYIFENEVLNASFELSVVILRRIAHQDFSNEKSN